MSETPITLITPGPIPGIPGDHGPGAYLVDYDARTIRPALDESEDETNESNNDEAPEATEPLLNLSADLAKGEVDDSSTATPTPEPTEQPVQAVEQASQPIATETATQPTTNPDVATEILHIEDELKTLTADQQQPQG